MILQTSFVTETTGRGMINITARVAEFVATANMQVGLCQVFLHHTSASLVISENADGLVQKDFESFMQRLVPDGDPLFKHIIEGPDDMPAHVRAALTETSLMIPITNFVLGLGQWQGIFLWEHRLQGSARRVTVTLLN